MRTSSKLREYFVYWMSEYQLKNLISCLLTIWVLGLIESAGLFLEPFFFKKINLTYSVLAFQESDKAVFFRGNTDLSISLLIFVKSNKLLLSPDVPDLYLMTCGMCWNPKEGKLHEGPNSSSDILFWYILLGTSQQSVFFNFSKCETKLWIPVHPIKRHLLISLMNQWYRRIDLFISWS